MINFLISIVVVVKNGKNGISRTLSSIREQNISTIEVIVIDGASTDGTLEIVKQYSDIVTRVVSEVDSGHYEAYNKGSNLAQGEYIIYLNSGDYFSDSKQLEIVFTSIGMVRNSLFYCRAKIIGGEVNFYYPPYGFKPDSWHLYNLPNMQTIFFPKSFYSSNKFDLRLCLTADDDYKLVALQSLNVNFIETVLVEFARDGISSNHRNYSMLKQRICESFILNRKHERYVRFILDPLKRITFFFIQNIFGDEIFLKFIKFLKG